VPLVNRYAGTSANLGRNDRNEELAGEDEGEDAGRETKEPLLIESSS